MQPHQQKEKNGMTYKKKEPAEVRAARQAAAAKSAEVRRRKKEQRGEKARRVSIEAFAPDAEALAQMANEMGMPRIQFIHDWVAHMKENVQKQKGE